MPRDDRRACRQGNCEPEPAQSGSMLMMTADLVPKFSGQDKTYSVTQWTQEVDDHAAIFGWSPLQQLLVARRALTGTAALWLRAERPHKAWEELKGALTKEFADAVDTKTIHEMMTARKKKENESCLDYLLTMKELGRRGKMSDYVAIRYIVDGILDTETNKMMLYGITSYSELKEKLKIYETIKEKMKIGFKSKLQVSDGAAKQEESRKKCFSCGKLKHLSAECPMKHLGLKCFKCNQYGHIASKCSGKRDSGNPKNLSHKPEEADRPAESSSSKVKTTYFCECETERNLPEEGCDAPIGCSCERNQDGGDDRNSDEDRTVMATAVLNVNKGNVMCKKPTKLIRMCGKEVSALIDSGSDLNLVSSEWYRDMGAPKCDETDKIAMTGLGAARIQAEGLFRCDIIADGRNYKDVGFYIVPGTVMPFSVILGQQFLQQIVMVMEKSNVYLLPSNEEWLRNLTCFVSDLDIIGSEVSQEVQRRVRNMIASYQPMKSKEAPIELQIHLKDEIPVTQRPRRLALKEQQEVDKQMREWLDNDIIQLETKKKQKTD